MTASTDNPQSAAIASKESRDAFARLTQFGWNGGLAIILLGLTLSFFLAGYFVIYWRNADMDLVVVYSAMVLNDGKQTAFDHPAYFTIFPLKLWFQFLHSLGLLDASKLSALPSTSNVPAFDAAMTGAVRAGRALMFLTGTLFVLVFASLMRSLVRNWWVALLATFAFAFSGGVAVHLRTMRSEMIAACLVTFALMILIVIARRGTSWRPLAVGGAAALCVLGLENKIHVILLIAALPMLILPFGAATGVSTGFWNTTPRTWLAASAAAIIAAMLCAETAPLIRAGFDPVATSQASLHPLIAGTFGTYQVALAGWICACMIAFAAIWRISMTETLTSIFAAMAGAALALLALNLQYNVLNVVTVINPIEKMLLFADRPAASAVESGGIFAAVGVFLSGVMSVLQRYTFFLFTSPRPTVFLTWLILPGIVYAWLRGERQAAIQATLLMLTAIGVDSLGVRRGLKAEYFILTDPLIIIAGALLLDRMGDLRFSRWAYSAGAALIVAHVVLSQAEPVKMVLKRSGPENICEWNQYFMPLLPLPWCERPLKIP